MLNARKDDANALAEKRAALSLSVKRAAGRAKKRAAAIRGDLSKIEEAELWAASAQWLVVAAAKAQRGATALKASDWSTGEERTLEVTLDPARSAREQVEAMFRQARRLRKGKSVALSRLADAEELAALLSALGNAIEGAETAEALEELLARAKELAPRDFALQRQALRGKTKLQGKKPPFRTFVGTGGVRVLVGRGAADNDELTFDVARPHHLFLHAKGHTGAHVIAWIGKGHDPTSDLLVDAAHLAAHFSEARGESLVEVSYVERRHVRKPRRSPPGLVVLDREKVISLRIEASRLEALLASEVEAEAAPPR